MGPDAQEVRDAMLHSSVFKAECVARAKVSCIQGAIVPEREVRQSGCALDRRCQRAGSRGVEIVDQLQVEVFCIYGT